MRRETKFSELKDMSEGYGSNINNPLLKDPDIIKNPDLEHLYQSSDVFQKILKRNLIFRLMSNFIAKMFLETEMLNELSDEIVL